MYCTRRINDDYTWVGADGRRLAMFEGVFDVPAGISFNSYLLRDEKTVLFDTTDAAVRRTFRENLLHAPEGQHRYVCKVCGYVYEGDSLPEDYKCPLCGAGAEYFKQES